MNYMVFRNIWAESEYRCDKKAKAILYYEDFIDISLREKEW